MPNIKATSRFPSQLTRLILLLDMATLILFLSSSVIYSAKDDMRAMRWSPDNTKIALGYSNGNIEIIDVISGTSTALGKAELGVLSFAWNPVDPDILAVSYYANLVHLFDVSTGEMLQYLDTEADIVPEVDWNWDGTKLATITAYDDYLHVMPVPYLIHIWDPSNGQLLHTLEGHGNSLTSVSWSNLPNDNRLLSAGEDRRVMIWDGDTGTLLARWTPDTLPMQVAWAPDKPLVAMVMEDRIEFWNMSQAAPIKLTQATFYAEGNPQNLTWRPDGLAVAFVDGNKIKFYQLWSQFPYISNMIVDSMFESYLIDWSSGTDFAYADDVEFYIVPAPVEDDPELAPTPTGTYETPTRTPTPFGTLPAPTETPFPAPIPDAGPDRIIETYEDTAVVPLSARGSIDPENRIVGYGWHVDNVDTTTGMTTTALMTTGVHTIKLQIVYLYINGSYASVYDTATITIIKIPPPTPTYQPSPIASQTPGT